jgi:hypothetical protein
LEFCVAISIEWLKNKKIWKHNFNFVFFETLINFKWVEKIHSKNHLSPYTVRNNFRCGIGIFPLRAFSDTTSEIISNRVIIKNKIFWWSWWSTRSKKINKENIFFYRKAWKMFDFSILIFFQWFDLKKKRCSSRAQFSLCGSFDKWFFLCWKLIFHNEIEIEICPCCFILLSMINNWMNFFTENSIIYNYLNDRKLSN